MCGEIGPRQQAIDLAIRVAVDDPGDDVDEVGVRLYADELVGLDQRGDDGPMFTAAVGADEQGILAIGCNRADGAFGDVGTDLDAAVVDEVR